MAVFPINVTDIFKFDAMAVKLKGLMVNTKPSRGLYSRRFNSEKFDFGCSS